MAALSSTSLDCADAFHTTVEIKIIRTACCTSPLESNREELLNEYLDQMLDKLGWPKDDFQKEHSFGLKEPLRCLLEEALKISFRSLHAAQRFHAPTNEFDKFSHLPAEIRIAIWKLAFGLDQTPPTVYCVDERGGRFISNQPVSPLLRTCHEARNIYLNHPSRKFLTFDFGTYIDFNKDVVYLIDYEDKEGKFARFIDSPSASKIQKLAMRKSLACEIPIEGHMSEVQWVMKEGLQSWVELSVVFHNKRSPEQACRDTDMRFRTLSAREKRKHAEIAYARAFTKTLNSMMRTLEDPETDCLLVRVVEEEHKLLLW